MNQILYTGKNKNKSKTSSNVVFFSIVIIIFAICIIALGIFLFTRTKQQNGNEVANNSNQNTENGQSQSNEKENQPNEPEQEDIKVEFTSTDGGIKFAVTSEKIIKSIEYNWDKGENVNVEVPQDSTELEQNVEITKGTHTIYVTVTDIDGNTKSISQKVKAAIEPEVTIGTDGVSKFVIKAKDEENLKKLTIILNDKTTELDISGTEYEYSIEIPEGDSHIKVIVENTSSLTAQKEAQIRGFVKR